MEPASNPRRITCLTTAWAAIGWFWASICVADNGAATLQGVADRLARGDVEGITGGMLSIDGERRMEAYAPGYSESRQHDIRSATKSITALLVGELIDDGTLRSVRTPLSELIPDTFERLPTGDTRRDITIEDALTMRTGLACDDWSPASVGHEDKMYRTDDWAAFLLSQPMSHERGKHFSYCTGGVVLLGRVIERLSGQAVPEFANERLFEPLGITGAKWESTPTGHTDTGGHLRLRLEDLHRIGQLVLADGDWRGERLVQSRWLQASTREQTHIPERRERYGYLWWLDSGQVKGQDIRLLFAHGNGGNFIFIIPELDLVAAFTGKNYGKPTQFLPMQLLTREIVPALID